MNTSSMHSIAVVLWIEKRMGCRIAFVYFLGIAITVVGASSDVVLFNVKHAPLVHVAILSLGQCLGGRAIVGINDRRQDKLGSHGRTGGHHYALNVAVNKDGWLYNWHCYWYRYRGSNGDDVTSFDFAAIPTLSHRNIVLQDAVALDIIGIVARDFRSTFGNEFRARHAGILALQGTSVGSECGSIQGHLTSRDTSTSRGRLCSGASAGRICWLGWSRNRRNIVVAAGVDFRGDTVFG
mmetsp:Transcript_25262/g.53208  ORF Transcript_25262/g.53208 Transcript_25262/m.53208 type:complete len:238 (+) Transcript_25262:100-813(+)